MAPGADDDVVRVLYLLHTATVQDFQEVATLVRTMADIRRVFSYNSPRALVLRGTAAQMAMAEWLSNELDQPGQSSGKREYRAPGANDDVVRVFYLPRAKTVQDFQEVATLVRTISEIQRVFTYNGPRALALRGTAGQAALAEWLFAELDHPASSDAKHEYWVSGRNDDVVRVFYLPATRTVQDFQASATRIRSITKIPRVFTYNAPRALALRGTFDQIVHAEQLIQALDQANSSK